MAVEGVSIGPVHILVIVPKVIPKPKRYFLFRRIKLYTCYNLYENELGIEYDDNGFQCYTANLERSIECQLGCKNDLACINQCFVAFGEQNALCPCGKFCESINNDIFDICIFSFCLEGCPCTDCEACWECTSPIECLNKEDEIKVEFS